ncbi:MAG: ACP S-malonyltransferase [Erysipelothrix sp.]|jgi:[acyl-carrier-protein] S-malonyltransferase|nr:ACP S-malonyltransferase [Erysipelothrix sp.]
MMAGLSLGELTALSFTQALSLADGIASVTKRGQIIADALHGHDSSMMAIIGLKTSTIQKICEKVATVGVCEIATFSYPGQIVISGHKNALEIAKVECLKYGAKRVIPLNVAGAFHSSLLNNAAASFEKELASITFKNSQIPIVFNTTGKVETDNLKNIVVKQLHSPIYFQQSIEFMINQGVDYFIEIGPGNILRGYVRKINPQIACYSVNTVDDLQRCVDYLR